MIDAFIKAIAQCMDPIFRQVLWRSVAGAMGILLLLWGLIWGWLGSLEEAGLAESLNWLPGLLASWISWILNSLLWAAAFGAMISASYFLFPPLMVLIIGLYLEVIIEAVETKYYPGQAPVRTPPLSEVLINGLKFFGFSLLINLLVSPLYLIPFLNYLVFCVVNGYILGREFFEMVAFRRMVPYEAQALRRKARGAVFGFGLVITLLFTLPVINLLAPLLAATAMVHFFQHQRVVQNFDQKKKDEFSG